MNCPEACASVRIHAGAVPGNGAVKRSEAACNASRTSAPGAGGAAVAVATKYTGWFGLKSAAKFRGQQIFHDVEASLRSIRCQKFQYHSGAAVNRPWLTEIR